MFNVDEWFPLVNYSTTENNKYFCKNPTETSSIQLQSTVFQIKKPNQGTKINSSQKMNNLGQEAQQC